MNKQDFIDNLEKDNLSKEDKIAVCQFYMDNYPVMVDIPNVFSRKRKQATALNVKIDGGSEEAVNRAFDKLKSRINEFKLS